MIYLIHTIYQDMDENKITGALFLDLCKAFDTINHKILSSKFKLLDPNDQMLNWLKSYIRDRKQVVSFKGITIHSSF